MHIQTDRKTNLFPQVFSYDLPDLLHTALRCSAVQDLQRAGVLLRQEVVQGSQVLPYFNEGASVCTTQVPESLCWTPVNLKKEKQIKLIPFIN